MVHGAGGVSRVVYLGVGGVAVDLLELLGDLLDTHDALLVHKQLQEVGSTRSEDYL